MKKSATQIGFGSKVPEASQQTLLESYKNIGVECKDNILWESVLLKYSPALHHENYNEKYCVVNEKGFYMY